MPYWIAPILGCAFMLVSIVLALYTARQADMARLHKQTSAGHADRAELASGEASSKLAVVTLMLKVADERAEEEAEEATQPCVVIPFPRPEGR